MTTDEESRPGGEIPERLERRTKSSYAQILRRPNRNATRDERRVALLKAMQPDRVLDFADYVRRVRARLDADLLDENPDQTAGARAWGLR